MKNTFASKTFACHSFRSGNWTGIGIDQKTGVVTTPSHGLFTDPSGNGPWVLQAGVKRRDIDWWKGVR